MAGRLNTMEDSVKRKTSEYEIQDHPDNTSCAEANQPNLKYPKSVFFIVSNEFCERFSYYGMRTILTLYLRNKLSYSDDTSTVIYHVFTMFVYFFPLFGAMLADSVLGKFRTIFYVSIIYAIGQLLLALSAAPPIGLPPKEFSIIGLLLIAVGTGGIKPCVAAFGGDQFILPQQERYLSSFFSLFYFAINSGSLISSFLTPVLRSDVRCFGETSCYSVAFLVPAVLMIISIVIFVLGKRLYRIVDPKGNVVLNVTKCIGHAISNKVRSKKVARDHWLDHADDTYEPKLIDDIKAALQVLKLFIPLPVFWALFDQQGSRWTIQATRMNGELGSYLIQPDQMQVVNPLLILIFIPLFETCIYPVFSKLRITDTPLKKLTVGGLLASLSFVVSAIVELQLEKTYPILPSSGVAQVRIFNTMQCDVNLTLYTPNEQSFVLHSLDYWEDKYIKADGDIDLKYHADFANCKEFMTPTSIDGKIAAKEAAAISWALTPNGFSYMYVDHVEKLKTGNPAVRGLIYMDSSLGSGTLRLKSSKDTFDLHINSTFQETELKELSPGPYDIIINDKTVQKNVNFRLGGVYTITGYDMPTKVGKMSAQTITVTEPNSLHILWLIPQYIIITMGEVMFSVTGLEFAFTQAPASMKSLLQASWLLTVAFGNLIVVIVAEVSLFSSQVYEFILFAGLMFVDIIIFAIMAKFYKYVEVPDDESENGDIALKGKNGSVNASYRDDEK